MAECSSFLEYTTVEEGLVDPDEDAEGIWFGCRTCEWTRNMGTHTSLEALQDAWAIHCQETALHAQIRAMSGDFFDPTPPRPHHCQLPDAGSAAATGSLRGWRCECGKAYERYTASQHGESWQQWRRIPKFDKKETS